MDVISNFDLFLNDKKVERKFSYNNVNLAALSFAAYRKWKSGESFRFEVLETITCQAEDYIETRKAFMHFQHKYCFAGLTGYKLSPFQDLMLKFLSGELLEHTQDQIGLIYKIPYLYYEDKDWESVISVCKTVAVADPIFREHKKIKNQILCPTSKVFRSRKNNESYQYVFADELLNAYILDIKTNNPLLSLISNLCEQQTVEVTATCLLANIKTSNFFYWKLIELEKME